MSTRTQIFTLLGISVGLAPLVGCDDPDAMHDLDATEAAIAETEAETETEAEPGTTTDTTGDEPSVPQGPASAELLRTTPDDEVMLAAPINLALHRPAVQSSTHGPADASRAVDGNHDGNYFAGSVTHTDNGGENWWQVDLESVAPVAEVVISNRTDCCSGRLHDFTVYVSADGVHWQGFAHPGVAGEKTRVLIDRPARWVKISNPETLSLAEVEVLRTRNLAYGKPATQSSTAVGGDPARAVDGNTDGQWNNNSVTHTEDGAHEWWQVDLGSVQSIGHAVLFNRADCCAERLHDFVLRVSNDGHSWFDVPFHGAAGPQVVLPVHREGRFVRIVNGQGPLSLAEVQLFEAPRLPGLSYGRGVGTVPAAFGCAPGDEQNGLLCYPRCADGYYGNGPVCWQGCAPGFTDMGAYCIHYGIAGWPSYWKGSYGRGAGTPLVSTCGGGLQYDAGLCYPACEIGYKGVGPVCWLENATVGAIAGEACDRLRVPFMSALADEVDEALTVGVGLGLSAYAAVSAELGLAYGSDGEFGCYVTGCGGFTTGGLSIGAYVTAGMYDDFSAVAGTAKVISAGPSIGIPETPIVFSGTLGVVTDLQGNPVGTTLSAGVNISEPTPIDFSFGLMTCETAVLQTQG